MSVKVIAIQSSNILDTVYILSTSTTALSENFLMLWIQKLGGLAAEYLNTHRLFFLRGRFGTLFSFLYWDKHIIHDGIYAK